MKQIQLTKGKLATVDDVDYEWLSCYKWSYNSDTGYAFRVSQKQDDGDSYNPKRRHKILMHRVINNTPAGFDTDHINKDKLDNRKSNLRTVTRSENNMNRKVQRNSITGVKGVSPMKSGKWKVRIGLNGKQLHIGVFDNIEDASEAYNKKAKELFGDKAQLSIVKNSQ